MRTSATGEPAGAKDRKIGSHPLARYRDEFPIFRDRIYLNTCSLGPLGERTRRRVTGFLDEWQTLIARARALGLKPRAAGAGGADARPGHARLSPFFYNVQEDHVRALACLAAISD